MEHLETQEVEKTTPQNWPTGSQSAIFNVKPPEASQISVQTIPIEPAPNVSQPAMLKVKVEQERRVEVMSPAPVDFPEGGWQAWANIAGAFLVQYACFGYVNAFGVYQDFYVRHYMTKYTAEQIGWIGGTQIFLTFAVGAFGGRVFDRGYLYHLMVGSILLDALGTFTLSVTHENQYYQVFLSQGLCLSIGCGLSYVPSLGIISHYFHRRRALAAGVVSAGSALGAILHPIMLNKLFNGPIGFHNGIRISGALNVFLLIVATLLMRTRLPPKQGNVGSHFPIVRYLKDVPYALVLLAGIFAFSGLFFPIFYLQLDAVLHGVDTNLAFYAISILNAGSLLGRIIPNVLAPRIGVYQLMMISMSGAGVIILSMIAVKDAVGVILFGVFYGFFTGAGISLVPLMIALVAEDVDELGTRMGMYFLFAGFLGLFATPIAGALLTPEYHWIRAILFSGIMMIAAGITFGLAGYLATRRKRTRSEQSNS